jgi:aspartate aminotransferase-like enzyme
MLQVGQYVFKLAETEPEFEEIHCLNYRTFVAEISQHADPGGGALVDKFHAKNAYLIAVRGGRVVGMLGVHDRPPFSVAERLPEPAVLERPGTRPLEVRLLAIEPAERNTPMFLGLMWFMHDYAQQRGYTHLFISGIEERVELYERMGFTRLGPAVRSGQAFFVPMALTVGQLPPKAQKLKKFWESHIEREGGGRSQRTGPRPGRDPAAEVCLLPGPVTTSAAVRRAFHEPPIYHRGPEFIARFVHNRRTLAALARGRDVAILNGSGTLANECVAATLAADARPARGVLLSNGEFGQRLARQATRFGLSPRVLSWPWGQPWDLEEVADALAQEPPGSWVWGVHQESSTGVLNDLPGLVRVARARDVRVCVDCVSSLGAVPLDLSGVYLATGATGKSLGAYAGAALIFADARALARIDRSQVPSYFDLAAALASDGPCYTFPSPTLRALEAALADYATPEKAQARYERYAALGAYVRQQLRELGLEPVAPEGWACPVVTTFAPPGDEPSGAFVERCRAWGFVIGGQSGYLAERRLVQIATMGAVGREDCAPFFKHLRRLVGAEAAACQPVAS